jgi:outer membrane cobalamin receptor
MAQILASKRRKQRYRGAAAIAATAALAIGLGLIADPSDSRGDPTARAAEGTGTTAPFDSLPVYVLDPVVVVGEAWGIGEGAPAAASVIAGSTLARAGMLRLADALRTVPGVRVARFGAPGSFAAVSVRGTRSEQVVVLVDGRRLTTAQGGGVDLGSIDVATLERVEVLRGGASALYGANALGGVIHLVTRPPAGSGGTSLRLEGGSFGTAAGAARYGRTLGKGGRLWLKGHGMRTGGDYSYEDRGIEVGRDNAAAHGMGTAGGLHVPLASTGSLNLDCGLETSEQGVPGTIEFPTPAAHRADRRASAAAELALFDHPAAATRVVAGGRLDRQRRSYSDEDRGIDDRHLNQSAAVELRIDRSFASNEPSPPLSAPDTGAAAAISAASRRLLTAGVELRRDALASTTDGNPVRQSAGMYLRGHLGRGRLLFAPAARLDASSDFAPFLSARLAVGLDLPAGHDVRLSAARSYRPPSFDDLFFPDVGGALGNPALRPERAFDLELGLGRTFGRRSAIRSSGFWQQIEDLILWSPGPDGRWRPHNVGRAVLKGIELEGRTAMAIAGLAGPVEVAASLDLLDARNRTGETNVDGRRLPYRPGVAGRLEVALPPTPKLRLIAAWQAVSRSFVTPSNTKSVPGHGVIDVTAEHWLSERIIASLAVLNLADVEAVDVRDYPLPGREWRLGLRLSTVETP